MNSNEIRIGNLTYYNMKDSFDERKEWKEINVIDAEDILYLSNNPDDDLYEPIPINSETLKLIGLNQESKDIALFRYFSLSNDYELEFDSYPSGIIFEFIHQIQNAYHALTGKELTIIK